MEPLKNEYNETKIKILADEIKYFYHDFDSSKFIDSLINETWEQKELKERMRAITLSLNTFLPDSYIDSLDILKKVQNKFTGLFHLIFPDFVEVFGLDYYEESIKALKLFTSGCSSEFAVRQYLIKYPNFIEEFKQWTKDESEHVRRLASEGCRPRLPWAVALPEYKKNPSKVLEILELLKNDKSKYVQKSVANNLNDISKDNPDMVIKFVENNLGSNKDLDWICKHASRTLLKKGDKKTLELFGFKDISHVRIEKLTCDEQIILGDKFNFSFTLSSARDLGNLRVEYGIDYLKSNGTYSRKLFMITQNEIKSKQKTFIKKHLFKQMTTRKHYLGEHYISILLNGEEKIKKRFFLK